jgi:predicted Fe-Mo cluster-binding NifX family protein
VGNVLRTGAGLISGGSNGDDAAAASMGCSGGAPLAGGDSSGSSSGQGEELEVSWPSADDWDMYGLKGLSQPAGSKVAGVMLYQGVYYVTLENAGKDAYDALVKEIRAITGARAPYSDVKTGDGQLTQYQYGNNNEHLVSIAVSATENTIVLNVLR